MLPLAWPAPQTPSEEAGGAERAIDGAAGDQDGLQILWRIPFWEGFSGLTAHEGQIYTMYARGQDEFAVALDLSDGDQLWRVRTDSKFENESGNGPRSTPVFDQGRVYFMGAQSKLYALNAEDGAQIWRRDLVEDFDAVIPFYGTSASVLIEGDLAILNVGGRPDHLVVAFDKRSGEKVWNTHTEPEPGYSTPIAATIDGRRQVISLTGASLLSLAPESGEVLWSFPWKTLAYVNVARPVYVPQGRIFISSSYGMGAAMLQVTSETGGSPGLETVWRSRVMRNHFASSLYRRGCIYGFDNATLKCIDADSGQTQWAVRGLGRGSLAGVGEFMAVLSEQGELIIIEATAAAYTEVARTQALQGRCFTAPLVGNGKLVLRNESQLACLDLRFLMQKKTSDRRSQP